MLKHGSTSFGIMYMLNSENLMGINTIALEEKDFYVMLLGLFILMRVDYFRNKKDLKAALADQNVVFRWMVYYMIIFIILVFGIYGPVYDASTFIYFQF